MQFYRDAGEIGNEFFDEIGTTVSDTISSLGEDFQILYRANRKTLQSTLNSFNIDIPTNNSSQSDPNNPYR